MHAEDLAVHEGSQGEVVEQVGAVPPDVEGAVLLHTLVVEPVHLRYDPGLVVASQQADPVPVPDLERDEEKEDLHAVVSPIDVVPHEDVVGIRGLPADLEQLQKVLELAVDVSANLGVPAITVTGASTLTTLDSSERISLALSHSTFT